MILLSPLLHTWDRPLCFHVYFIFVCYLLWFVYCLIIYKVIFPFYSSSFTAQCLFGQCNVRNSAFCQAPEQQPCFGSFGESANSLSVASSLSTSRAVSGVTNWCSRASDMILLVMILFLAAVGARDLQIEINNWTEVTSIPGRDNLSGCNYSKSVVWQNHLKIK